MWTEGQGECVAIKDWSGTKFVIFKVYCWKIFNK